MTYIIYIYKAIWKKGLNTLKKTNQQGVHQWSGRPGFNPRSGHTKDFKNGTLYLFA